MNQQSAGIVGMGFSLLKRERLILLTVIQYFTTRINYKWMLALQKLNGGNKGIPSISPKQGLTWC